MTELDVAREAARAAGAILRAHVDRGPVRYEEKGAANLVTAIDRACEDAIRAVLARHTPDVPVLGEEGGGDAASGALWVVDPLDGTTNFVHGFPFFAVSVALRIDGRGEVGVVLDVVRGREYAAWRGRGATRDGVPIHVSAVDALARALAGTGFPYDRQQHAAEYLRYVQAALERTHGVRRAGAAALDLCLLAEGALDVFWEFKLSPWDVAAGVLIIEEAGGRVTAHDGSPLAFERPSPLATNGVLHDAMIRMLEEVRSSGVSAAGEKRP